MRLVTLPGVFRPPSDSWFFVETLRERGHAHDASVLDVFTGSGVLAVAAALAGARAVTAVDVSRRALVSARLNARLNGRRVRALRGDIFEPVRGERFGLVLANPPYVPGATDELPASGRARAWEGGRDGRLLVDRFCEGVAGHLEAGGTALMVHSSLTGEEESLAALRSAGLAAEVIARSRGGFGPIVAARAELLEERGLVAPGDRSEELLVIEAVKL